MEKSRLTCGVCFHSHLESEFRRWTNGRLLCRDCYNWMVESKNGPRDLALELAEKPRRAGQALSPGCASPPSRYIKLGYKDGHEWCRKHFISTMLNEPCSCNCHNCYALEDLEEEEKTGG